MTGASRGIGRGIAVALGEAGCAVYLTGRTLREGDSDMPGSITAAAEEVTRAGGTGIAVRCDHRVDSQAESAFERVRVERGRLDVLVNNATHYATSRGPPDRKPFWEMPLDDWDMMVAVGLRSHYVASLLAARMMVPQQSGVIVNVSSIGAVRYMGNVPYNVVKAGVDMLTLATAEELRPHGVSVVSFWPRFTKTEIVLANRDRFPDLGKAWSPIFTGRAVAALVADPKIAEKAGKAVDLGTAAVEYGLKDEEGRQPAAPSH